MVSKFEQPNFTAQDAATYKANIDNSIRVLAETGKQFAAREMATPAMGVTIESGLLMDGTVVVAQNVTGIGAPSANPRIDRIYFDLNLRQFQRVVGAEAATPTKPALPYGVFPVCSIYLTVGQTSIVNANITDERTMIAAPAAFFAGDGYTSIVDAAGLLRMIIGKAGVDNRFITRLHNDTDAKFVIQNSSGADVHYQQADGVTYYNVPSAVLDKSAGGAYYFKQAGSTRMTIDSSTISAYVNLVPNVASTRTLGTSSLPWGFVFSAVVNLGGANAPTIRTGVGAPEGVQASPVGSLYLRSGGGAATTLYVKESGGTGNTGWVAK
ncbi:hypothetical protein AbSZ3_01 [Acinetobacter phage Ab_SZ3]|uniref:Uncharacterized protein n=1 Tax=Acinetobacter phage Ab_SZ3 TaxID=2781361 RepID=A0A873WPM4_9CAUD|nr:hypothetical protein AbSZ3_01 [Acinetobacter phage Ab_SZ3]